jgi:DNA-binding MarR family transcriptional regulator
MTDATLAKSISASVSSSSATASPTVSRPEAPVPRPEAQVAPATDETHGVGPIGDEELIDMIELLFFAYRDFISDPDTILDELAFGRAHHRVLYFVNRNPGMTVAELLDILKITKQSLGRVLRDLVEADFIIQRPGAIDRRQRLLHPTAKGEALARRLTEPQMRRIAAALSLLGPEGADMTSRFLRLMINERDRGVPTGRLPKP